MCAVAKRATLKNITAINNMSAPHDNHSDSTYPEDKVTHYPKGSKKKAPEGRIAKIMHMAKRLKGLQETKHFGAHRRARHHDAQKKARGEDVF